MDPSADGHADIGIPLPRDSDRGEVKFIRKLGVADQRSAQPKLGLALGSGSARAWAHVGVIRALAEQGITPDCVSGCSMGAMVGAAFASGCIDKMETWARSLDRMRIVKLLDIGWPGSLVKGDRLLELFQGQFANGDFSDLLLPFAAVATDLASGQEVWLQEGSVADAVRASCTIPGLFEPVLHQGRYLVDGALVNPVPVSLCRALGADIVIAVNLGLAVSGQSARLNSGKPRTPPLKQRLLNALIPRHIESPAVPVDCDVQPSLLETFLGAIDIMQDRIAQSHLIAQPADVILTPQLAQIGMFEFHRAAQSIDEGYEAVERMLPEIREALAVSRQPLTMSACHGDDHGKSGPGSLATPLFRRKNHESA